MNKSTIYDVALRAKVSNATVSRALNTPEKVKPETRNKILAIAKELGYKIIGQQSGGGSCSICSQTTADGIPFIRSNFVMCTNRAGDNIDGGVPVDYPIEYGSGSSVFYDVRPFYNIDAIGLYLSNAYKRIK